MRDIKRINRISKLIGKIWRKNPDLRLGQLLLNCYYPNCDDLYYIEDDELEKRLREIYLNVKPYTSEQLKKLKKALEQKLK